MALKYTINTEHSIIHVFTDSLSALHTLQCDQPTNNIRLMITIFFLIQQLEKQHRSLTFWWIPSHLNISGNDSADAAAKNNLRYTSVTGRIPPSFIQLKRQVRKTSYEVLLRTQGMADCRIPISKVVPNRY